MKTSPGTIVVCLIGMVLAALGLYFGGLLPLLKAQHFIDAQNRMSSVRTVADFEDNFDQVFNFYSPVGTEEVTKFLSGNILNILQNGQVEAVDRELVMYIEPHLFKNDVRHLLLSAQLRQTLWQKYHAKEDYDAAVGYYEKAHEIGPNLPPPLYSLLSLYTATNDLQNTERIAKIILANWPNDEKVRALFK